MLLCRALGLRALTAVTVAREVEGGGAGAQMQLPGSNSDVGQQAFN